MINRREYMAEWRAKHRQQIAERRKLFNQSAAGKEIQKKYRKSTKGRNARNRYLVKSGRLSPELEAICREPDRIGIAEDD